MAFGDCRGLWLDRGRALGREADGVVVMDERIARIAEIDAMFSEATGWGSWMVMCANEREGLVNQLREEGHDIEHKYLARGSDGRRVS